MVVHWDNSKAVKLEYQLVGRLVDQTVTTKVGLTVFLSAGYLVD